MLSKIVPNNDRTDKIGLLIYYDYWIFKYIKSLNYPLYTRKKKRQFLSLSKGFKRYIGLNIILHTSVVLLLCLYSALYVPCTVYLVGEAWKWWKISWVWASWLAVVRSARGYSNPDPNSSCSEDRKKALLTIEKESDKGRLCCLGDVLECRTSNLAARMIWRKVCVRAYILEGGGLVWREPDDHPFFWSIHSAKCPIFYSSISSNHLVAKSLV